MKAFPSPDLRCEAAFSLANPCDLLEDCVKMENPIDELQVQLQRYCSSGIYPMHMPGHKRELAPVTGLPYEWDVTEVEGTDDLHEAEGILKTAMDRTRDLVGSRRTWYLVGGSTCGNLAAIYAMVPKGAEVIAARNSHKSVYHAIELLELTVHWIDPETIPEFEIPGGVDPAGVESLLGKFPNSAAVILTSPTYEGVLSDIEKIAKVVHDAGKLLFVDEAHGAHLGLFRFPSPSGKKLKKREECYFPDSAVHLGADVVVQSAHKTLPSLTQTAYLHLCSDRVSEAALEQGLDIFETSSPSYPLMASLDGCTGWLLEEGETSFYRWQERLRDLERAACGWEHLSVLGVSSGTASETSCFLVRDPGKILIRSRTGIRSGKELQEFLRREEGIEAEMSCGGNALLMTSCADTDEGFRRLHGALEHLNRELGKWELGNRERRAQTASMAMLEEECGDAGYLTVLPEGGEMSLAAAAQLALHGKTERVRPDQAAGRVCAEYVTPYPPGIPLLIPGERITEDQVQRLQELLRTGARIRHSARRQRKEQSH